MRSASEILSALLGADPDRDTLLKRLCQDCADTLPITGVGLAFITEAGHQGVIAATDGPAMAMEELQFTLGEGPCLDAALARRPVLQPDLANSAERWPGFTTEAIAAGIAAIFAFPLHSGAIRIGILDLYRDTPGNLNPAVLAEALAYADAALLVMLHLQSQMPADGDDLHPRLIDPIENRAEVHQATGAISVHADVTMADALLLLRSHAYSVQRPVLEVARDVLSGNLRIHSPRNDHE